MAKKSTIDWIAFVLLIIGGLNIGLIGIGGWNVLDMVFGSIAILARIVNVLIGLSALYMLYGHFKK